MLLLLTVTDDTVSGFNAHGLIGRRVPFAFHHTPNMMAPRKCARTAASAAATNRRLRVNMGGEFTKTRVWERLGSMLSLFDKFALLPPQSQNRLSADIARKRRATPTARLQTNARPLRDGSEQFGSGTQAYGQI